MSQAVMSPGSANPGSANPGTLRLLIATPLSVLVDVDDVEAIRAEDETGSFGILPGHADFLTVLVTSVVSWKLSGGREHVAALRGGTLRVHGGNRVEIATRQAVDEASLAKLGPAVLDKLFQEEETVKEERVSTTALQAAAIRSLQRYLRSSRPGLLDGATSANKIDGARGPDSTIKAGAAARADKG